MLDSDRHSWVHEAHRHHRLSTGVMGCSTFHFSSEFHANELIRFISLQLKLRLCARHLPAFLKAHSMIWIISFICVFPSPPHGFAPSLQYHNAATQQWGQTVPACGAPGLDLFQSLNLKDRYGILICKTCPGIFLQAQEQI